MTIHPLREFENTWEITAKELASQFGRSEPTISAWKKGVSSATQGDMMRLLELYEPEVVARLAIDWMEWIRENAKP